MRLSVHRMREGLTHADPGVRQYALRYFAEALSRDEEAMQLAIESVERFGWDEAFEFPYYMEDLLQNEDTVKWVLDRAERCRPEDGQREITALHERMRIIIDAPIDVLESLMSRIAGVDGVEREVIQGMEDRLALSGMDALDAWDQIIEYLREHGHARVPDDLDYQRLSNLAEVIASEPDEAMRIVEEHIGCGRAAVLKGDPWLVALSVKIAGLMRRELAAEWLVDALHVETDWISEECSRALAAVGSDTSVEAIRAAYPTAEPLFQAAAAAALGRIRSDAALDLSRTLFGGEQDFEVKCLLARSILQQGDPDDITTLHEFVRDATEEDDDHDLKAAFVALSLIGETGFDELKEWQREVAEERKLTRSVMDAVLDGRPIDGEVGGAHVHGPGCGPACGHEHHGHQHPDMN